MDFWPSGSQVGSLPNKNGRKKKADREKTTQRDGETYPVVEHRSLTAANLVREGEGLEWSFILRDGITRKLKARHSSVKVFPASRPQRGRASKLSVTQQSEKGADFLRTYYPDVDIPAELIREELAEDSKASLDLQAFDPYAGDLLATLVCRSERTRKKHAFLAFPMGQTGSELNISPLAFTRKDLVTFKPCLNSLRTFDTPIQQIVSYVDEVSPANQAYLAVRTAGGMEALEIQPKPSLPNGVITRHLGQFTRSDTEDRPLVDIIFRNMPAATLLAINDRGDIFKGCLEHLNFPLERAPCASASPSEDNFWRLSSYSDPETVLVLSSTALDLRDFRADRPGLTLMTSPHNHVFTSAEGPILDDMVRISSTTEVLWIDKRQPQRPVLAVKHERKVDRTLKLRTTLFRDSPVTILSSRRNDLVTVYDVSAGSDKFVHLNTAPYVIPPMNTTGPPYLGQTVFRYPSEPPPTNAILLRLSDRGSIHQLDLSADESSEGCMAFGHEWSEEVRDLDKHMETKHPEPGPLGAKTFTETDLEPAYRRLFEMDSPALDVDANDTYDTLDAMRTFWQDHEAPVDQILTSFDVAFRSGKEPSDPSRADLLTGSALNTTRGYRALMQGRIPRQQVSKHAGWHHNWTTSLQQMIPDIASTPEGIATSLNRYNLQVDDYRTGPSLRRETEAREQLTLDLALSSDVYSPHLIKAEETEVDWDDAVETMSRAAEALHIGDPEPAPVAFGFLRPVVQDPTKNTGGNVGEKVQCPLGVRLLLSDWDIGSDPTAYTYQDPYDTTEPRVMAPRARRQTPDAHNKAPVEPRLPAQRMPPVITTVPMGPPLIAASQPTRPIAQSQGAPTANFTALALGSQPPPFSSSQPSSQGAAFPSTQVLPGLFGGRPNPAKKKPVKKRMGGF